MSDTERDTFRSGIGTTTLASDRGAVDDVQEDSPIAVNGVAIPENTILNGGRNEEHFYSPQAARRAAEVLQRQIDDGETVHIVKNFHDLEGQAPADDIIGEVTAAGYSEGVGVVWEGEITDEATAQKVQMGYLDVSPTVARSLGDFDETMQARGVDDVAAFRDIAVVGRGQPGADVDVGPNPAVEALSRDAFERAAADDDADADVLELSRPEPDGFTAGAWPPGGASSVTLEGTFDGDLEAARRSATWIENDGEEFGDLSLFILDGEGAANTNALDSAWVLASQTDGPTQSDVEALRSLYETLAERANEAGALPDDEFEDVWADRMADSESDAMAGVDDAKAQLAEEYGVAVAALDAALDGLGDAGDGDAGDGAGDGDGAGVGGGDDGGSAAPGTGDDRTVSVIGGDGSPDSDGQTVVVITD